MTHVKHYIYNDYVYVEVFVSYKSDGGKAFSETCKLGYKWNSIHKMFYKSYRDKEYTKLTFDRDLTTIFEQWGECSVESFKCTASTRGNAIC